MEIKEKLGLLAALGVIMGVLALPSSILSKVPSFPFKELVLSQDYHLGLDLKGGTHLNYKVDLSQVEKYNLDDDKENDVEIPILVEGIRSTLEKRVNGLGVSEPNIYVSKTADEHHIIVELAGISDVEQAKAIVGKTIKLEFKELRDEKDSDSTKEKELIKKQAEMIYSKAKTSSDFATYGNSVQSSDGKIVFTKELKTQSELTSEIKGIWTAKEGTFFELKEITNGSLQKTDGTPVPITGYAIIKVGSKTGESINYEQIFVSTLLDQWKDTGLDGSHFKRAQVILNQVLVPTVGIEFDKEGAQLFGKITGRNIGKPVAIFVGGNLISAPVVNEEILGGVAQITGNFSMQDATKLKIDLNTGAIGAPVILSGQHQIEASLGAESLKLSVNASLWGILILLLFMIYKYRFLGFIASVALLFYSIILFFIIKNSGFFGMSIVLTLAGISGTVLSIGMAVDANILIFERTREELHDGKNLMAAVSIGFERAWSSIRDSNISSLITCAILIWFGTSMIRGFAINLAIGILISMFTAITCTKMMLQHILPLLPPKYKKYL